MAIVAEVLTQHGGTLADAAEAYARAGIANADALTAIWSAKYRYNLIRPVTYIRRVIDPAWNTVLPTPPFPEYVSAHSGQSAASLATLEALFGTNVPLVDHAHDADGFAPRSFDHIFAVHVLEHIHDLLGLMREMRRVLRPTGVLHAFAPQWRHPNAVADPTHVRFIHVQTFKYFCEAHPGVAPWRPLMVTESPDTVHADMQPLKDGMLADPTELARWFA